MMRVIVKFKSELCKNAIDVCGVEKCADPLFADKYFWIFGSENQLYIAVDEISSIEIIKGDDDIYDEAGNETDNPAEPEA